MDQAVQDATRSEVAETALKDRLRRKDQQMEEESKVRRKAKLERRIQAMQAKLGVSTRTTQCVYMLVV